MLKSDRAEPLDRLAELVMSQPVVMSQIRIFTHEYYESEGREFDLSGRAATSDTYRAELLGLA